MPYSFRLPGNASGFVVLVRRPVTFLVAVLFSLAALITSTFYTLSGLTPPDCPCCPLDDFPRTRTRPTPHPELTTSKHRVESTPSKVESTAPKPTALESLSSFVAASFRPHRPPPVARRGSHTKGISFPAHELDEVVEEEPEELPPTVARSDDDEPALTPDGGSEVETLSEVETMEDTPYEPDRTVAAKKDKPKGLSILTSWRWKIGSGNGSATSKHSVSPSDESSPTLSPTSSPSDRSGAAPTKSIVKHDAGRPRASTTSTASSVSRSVRFTGRRQVSLDSVSSTESLPPPALFDSPTDGPNLRSRKPLSGSTSTPSSASGTLFSKPSLRSLSPLSRSPVTSPEPSPPSSPRLGHSNSPFARCAIATRLARSHSIDSPGSSCSKRSGRHRARSVSPGPGKLPMPRLKRGSSHGEGSGVGLDSTGSSGLHLDDLL
ncbi:hypothetical protein JCM10212_000957 [Sporobolomyces blumeae]